MAGERKHIFLRNNLILIIILVVPQLISIFLHPFPVVGSLENPRVVSANEPINESILMTIEINVKVDNTGLVKFREVECLSPSLGGFNIYVTTPNGHFADLNLRMLVSCASFNVEKVKTGLLMNHTLTLDFLFSEGVYDFHLTHPIIEESTGFRLNLNSLFPLNYKFEY